MNTKKLIIDAAITTIAVGLTSKPIDNAVDKSSIPQEKKPIAKTMLKTGVFGLCCESIITDALRNGHEKYSLGQRAASKALISGALMGATYVISEYIMPSNGHDNSKNPDIKLDKDDYKIK
jgi:hypothetical protein